MACQAHHAVALRSPLLASPYPSPSPSTPSCRALQARFRSLSRSSFVPGLRSFPQWRSRRNGNGYRNGCRISQVITPLAMLPSANPEAVSRTDQAKWSARALKSFSMARLEARKLKFPNTGTEAILMGILTEGTSHAAKYLRANGVTLFSVRDETVKLLGKSDLFYFSPEHPPVTEPAQKALDWAIELKKKNSGDKGEVTTTHLLLGIWAKEDSAGHQILSNLGFNDANVKELEQTLKETKHAD